MKALFWISLFLPLAATAEDIDYFNESIEYVNPSEPAVPTPAVSAPPATTTQDAPKKGWGQGIMEYFEKLTGSAPAPAQSASVPTINPASALPNVYIQNKLKAKAQEIAQVRQQILQTTDGQTLHALTGTLQRLEAEHHQLLESMKQGSATSAPSLAELSPMAAPTPPVEKIMSQQPQPLTLQTSEEEALKIQLITLTQQEKDLTTKIKSTPDANLLSALTSQLERVQQNKNLVTLSLQDLQRRKTKHSGGFGRALLAPETSNIAMPVPTLTPSLGQVMPPDLPTYPEGWGGFGVKAPPAQPAGKPLTPEEWKQVQAQAEASFENKQEHTTYGAPKRPLWTPKDHLGSSRQKSAPTHAPIDHRQLVEKIRKEKIF